MDNLSEDTIKKLAEEIVNRKGGFYVEPEEHYKQHQRIDRFLDIWDSASSLVLKFFLGFFLVGVVIAIGLGFGLHK